MTGAGRCFSAMRGVAVTTADPADSGDQAGNSAGPAVASPGAKAPAELDGWLAAAAAERDEGAFEQLVRRHTAGLYAGALRTTGSPQLAEDVVQEAWLSAWLHLPGFQHRSAVRTWLVRIVTTKALNALRRPDRTVALDDAAERAGPSTEQDAEQRERARAVRAAVAALPARQREAVVLRDLEGLTYEQVAQALGCSVASVKSALFRGRQSLAVALEQYQPPRQHDGPAGGILDADG